MSKEFRKNIEVIVFGQHCWNSLGQIRSFGEIGIKSNVVWIENDAFSPKGSRFVKSLVSFSKLEDGLIYIINHFNDPNKKYFISTDSDEIISLLDQYYDTLFPRFIFFNAGEKGKLTHFMLKDVQMQIAEQSGFRVIETEVVCKGQLPKQLQYPIFTKSRDSLHNNWKKESFICNNETELLEAYRSIPSNTILLQKYIKKKNELALEGFSINHGKAIYIFVQGEYLRIEDGSYGTWKKNEKYSLGEELELKIQNFIKQVSYSGVFEIEFLKGIDGTLYFLEVNFRHTQYNHALTDMGVNLCELFINSELTKELDTSNLSIKSPSIVMNEYREYYNYIKTKRLNIFQWMNDIKKTDSFYFYDKHDKKYFAKKLLSLLLNKILSILYRYSKRIKKAH